MGRIHYAIWEGDVIKFRCPRCERSSQAVVGQATVTFKTPIVGVPLPNRIEMGLMTKVSASDLQVSLDVLGCTSCEEVSPIGEWKLRVVCACGRDIAEVESTQAPVLEMTYCGNYKSYLCERCWHDQSRRCGDCTFFCRLREHYET